MPPVTHHPPRLRALAALALTLLSGGCAREPRRATADEIAHIRAACPPGSFAAAMASNCPEIVR